MARRIRASVPQPAPQPGSVARVTPSAAAWRTALRLAGGDASRCLPLGEDVVVVLNGPRRKSPLAPLLRT